MNVPLKFLERTSLLVGAALIASAAYSRPMPSVGRRCHELRIPDDKVSWRIIYRIDADAIVIADVFTKKSGKTPKHVIETCKARLREYDHG